MEAWHRLTNDQLQFLVDKKQRDIDELQGQKDALVAELVRRDRAQRA